MNYLIYLYTHIYSVVDGRSIIKILVDAVFGHVSLDAYLGVNEI